ncbi:MAG: methyltransferase [Candidatus Levybacteria bacterium]|nr:methyltransferase [Candidatus Levybacteria bacterium]
MFVTGLNLISARRLLNKHSVHLLPYEQEFHALKLVIFPQVFNPAYTQVSGFLADNLIVNPNSKVLDMYCGSGALAFLAAKNARKIIGVDISPYAIDCAQYNAKRLNLSTKIEFRRGDLWKTVKKGEKFDLIIANPPLLPVSPENWLEMTIADSPDMNTTIRFLTGCTSHLSTDGRVLMTFSSACKVSFKNPLLFIKKIALEVGLSMEIIAERDAGYEIYRVLSFRKN